MSLETGLSAGAKIVALQPGVVVTRRNLQLASLLGKGRCMARQHVRHLMQGRCMCFSNQKADLLAKVRRHSLRVRCGGVVNPLPGE